MATSSSSAPIPTDMMKSGTGSPAGPGSPPPPPPSTAMMGGRKKTAWMSHVKATMRANKGKSLMQVLKMAKKTYKKGMKGGGGSWRRWHVASPLMVGGRRRSKSRKTRRSRRGGDIE
jgi:hypothetical protein